MEEKASDFLEKHTLINKEGIKQINMVSAVIELYARLKSAQSQIKQLNEGVGDICLWAEKEEKRIDELEGKKVIEIISEDNAKIILGK